MQARRGRVIVGWRQVPVVKARLRPVPPPVPRDAAAVPSTQPDEPLDEKDAE